MTGDLEKSSISESAETPTDADSVSVEEFFSGLVDRFKNAIETSKQGKTFGQKVMLFFSALGSNVQKLSAEEQKIKNETAEKVGQVLVNTPDEQLVSAVEKQLIGVDPKSITPDNRKVVKDFSTAGVGVGKSFGTQKMGKISPALDILGNADSKEKLDSKEKALLMAFGLETVSSLKSNPAYNSIDKLAAALDKFDLATKKGKGLDLLKRPRTIALLKFSAWNPEDLAIAFRFTSLVDLSLELKRKLTAAPLDYNEALKLQDNFSKLFPSTSKEDRAKALMTVNEILLAGGFPNNRQIAKLVFYINTADIEKTSNILQK
jgi:hypothetical protein